MLFPYDTEKEFGTKGRVPVRATLDGVPETTSLIKYGSPQHMLVVLKAVRESIGKAPGDTIEVVLWKDEVERVLEVPVEFQKRHGRRKSSCRSSKSSATRIERNTAAGSPKRRKKRRARRDLSKPSKCSEKELRLPDRQPRNHETQPATAGIQFNRSFEQRNGSRTNTPKKSESRRHSSFWIAVPREMLTIQGSGNERNTEVPVAPVIVTDTFPVRLPPSENGTRRVEAPPYAMLSVYQAPKSERTSKVMLLPDVVHPVTPPQLRRTLGVVLKANVTDVTFFVLEYMFITTAEFAVSFVIPVITGGAAGMVKTNDGNVLGCDGAGTSNEPLTVITPATVPD